MTKTPGQRLAEILNGGQDVWPDTDADTRADWEHIAALVVATAVSSAPRAWGHDEDTQVIRELRAEKAKLAARLAEVERDAERYRWLRDPDKIHLRWEPHAMRKCPDATYGDEMLTGERLDAAIDAARGAK